MQGHHDVLHGPGRGTLPGGPGRPVQGLYLYVKYYIYVYIYIVCSILIH